MKNYKLTIQYDGTDYAGWQIQKNAQTIQQKIIDAVEILLKERVNLIGSGRTDAGVHAWGQVANFRTEHSIDIKKYVYSLNSLLPENISILDMVPVDESFHARFDAKKRSYIYLISKTQSPFYRRYSYFYPRISECNMDKLNGISKFLIGTHDFTSMSRKDQENDDKECTIYDIHWRTSKLLTIFYIEANRFLHGMVRTIVGTTLFAVNKNLEENFLKDIIAKKDREKAAKAVPPQGLFLYKVRY
ncbi:MAG: tRNA pseudouridine(38-40) synthase TruA [Ignavibacteria bacterium RBG_13_36_8]|nr:MAG: tRNA pseudouridine(38-40) synthase TruA [Ignavibacteria bacterium RBG_13_36_8]